MYNIETVFHQIALPASFAPKVLMGKGLRVRAAATQPRGTLRWVQGAGPSERGGSGVSI